MKVAVMTMQTFTRMLFLNLSVIHVVKLVEMIIDHLQLNTEKMKSFKNEKERISVLVSQWMASKLSIDWDDEMSINEYLIHYPLYIKQEIGELHSRQPFAVRRTVARTMKADVHAVVAKNLNDRELNKKSWRR